MSRPHTGIAVDLRRGWAYMLKRRRVLLPYVLTVAAWAVSQGYLHGDVLHAVEAGEALAGLLGIHQVNHAAKG